jgi:hypothetical protein
LLTDTLTPVFLVNCLKTATYAFFGTGSDAFEPNETESAADPLCERLRAEAPDAVSPYAVAAPATPVRISLRRFRTGELPSAALREGSDMKAS